MAKKARLNQPNDQTQKTTGFEADREVLLGTKEPRAQPTRGEKI